MNTRPLVIFGIGELAQLAHYYFEHDSKRRVEGFTVDAKYAESSEFRGLPLVSFDHVVERFPPQDFDLFVAIGYTNLNLARAQKCAEAQAQGYRLATHVSSRASVWPDLEVGQNSMIMEGALVQPFAKISANVVIWTGALISHHVEIADNCFIASGVTVSGGVRIGANCFIGANATIREHLTIGNDCIIGAGALLLKDAPPGSGYLAADTRNSGIPSRRLQSLL